MGKSVWETREDNPCFAMKPQKGEVTCVFITHGHSGGSDSELGVGKGVL